MGIRLDNFIVAQKNVTRTRAQEFIKNEKVLVNGNLVTKPAFLVDENDSIQVNLDENYVSRGAFKLKKALDVFDVSVENKVVLDMGASTGGFTQVLIEYGAKKVYSVDVGQGELDKTLACNPQVVNMENTDIRVLTTNNIGDTEIVVGDLSFISLNHVLPKIKALFGKIECVLLFKPQFECGKDIAKKFKGVIKDKTVHKKLIKQFIEDLKMYDYCLSDFSFSPIKGKSGNIEYLLHLNAKTNKVIEIDKVVDEAFGCAK